MTRDRLHRAAWPALSAVGLGGLLTYLLARQAIDPGFTDYWGFIVVQIAITLAALAVLEAWFREVGGLSWYTHLVVTANTWADTLGTAGHLYERHAAYDKVTHFCAGIAITAAAADVLRGLHARGLIGWRPERRLLAAVLVTLLLNAGWETYEYLGDRIFDSGRHKGALDTIYDLLADAGGALLSAAIIAGRERPAGSRHPVATARLHPP